MCGSSWLVYVLVWIEPRVSRSLGKRSTDCAIFLVFHVYVGRKVERKVHSHYSTPDNYIIPKQKETTGEVVCSNHLSVGQTFSPSQLFLWWHDTCTGSTSLFSWQSHRVKTLASLGSLTPTETKTKEGMGMTVNIWWQPLRARSRRIRSSGWSLPTQKASLGYVRPYHPLPSPHRCGSGTHL